MASPTRRRRTSARRARLDPDVARAQLLTSGLALLADRSMGETLGHLRVQDLARDAGRTSGAFYHYWSNQDAYRADVLTALLAGDRVDAAADLFGGDAEVARDPIDRIRLAATRAQATLAADPGHRLELALWAHGDPRVAGPLLRRARRTDAAWATAIGRLLTDVGRRPAPPWDLAALSSAAVLLSDGLRTQALMDPSRLVTVQGPERHDWPLGGVLGLALLLALTEPGPVDAPPTAPAGDDADAVQAELPAKQRQLLELGLAAARRQPTGNALDHIRADDVVAGLGLTVGAFYHYWESQDDYRDDLVDALFDADRYMDPSDVEAQADAVLSAPTMAEGTRRATAYYWSVAAGHPANAIQLGFHALDDPYIAGRLAAETRALQAPWTEMLVALLDGAGRHVRPPLDPELVVLAMGAWLDGIVVRHGLDPTGLDPDEEGWTRWGRLCAALVDAATAPAGDDRDLFTVAREAFGG